MHRNRQTSTGTFWSGIGYHFWIRFNGDIEEGRPIHTVGAHAGAGSNGDSIGICLAGRLDIHQPRREQIESLVILIKRHIMPIYGHDLLIEGHNDHMATSCPGRHFPMEEVRRLLSRDQDRLVINGEDILTPIKNEGGRLYVLLDGEQGREWIQVRALANLLGATLTWNAETRTANMEVS